MRECVYQGPIGRCCGDLGAVHNRRRPVRNAATFGVILAGLLCLASRLPAADADLTARQILDVTGVQGGLIVHVNCGDGKLTAALRVNSRYLVQGLELDADRMAAARKNIQAENAYGPVSVIPWNGKLLPYAERMVNLLVVDGEGNLPKEEMLRVLAPNGVAYVKHAGQWTKTVKPWPADIDEWPQYLHAADGNPVAHDRVVGPPRHYQWIAEPIWLRDHDTDSSVNSVVTAQGRIFYLSDEAPTGLAGNHTLPDRWFLVARDGFNGLPLWKVPIRDWGWRQWKRSWFQNRPGDFPLNLQKRLLAVGNRVYATLGYHAAVSELDAATGKILQSYAGTEETCEILADRGDLILSIRKPQGLAMREIRAADGHMLWQTEVACRGTSQDYIKADRELSKIGIEPTLNTAADARTVVLLDGKDVVAVDRSSGQQRWRTKINQEADLWVGALMIQDGVVVQASKARLVALDAESGKLLWEQPKSDLGHLWYEWKDVFVIDGRVWTWSALKPRRAKPRSKLSKARPKRCRPRLRSMPTISTAVRWKSRCRWAISSSPITTTAATATGPRIAISWPADVAPSSWTCLAAKTRCTTGFAGPVTLGCSQPTDCNMRPRIRVYATSRRSSMASTPSRPRSLRPITVRIAIRP